jgi:hypothetical protein
MNVPGRREKKLTLSVRSIWTLTGVTSVPHWRQDFLAGPVVVGREVMQSSQKNNRHLLQK